MKNIRKSLFILIIIMTVFSCKMNVLGDIVCKYTSDYPFTKDAILLNSNNLYSQYVGYVYTRLLKHSISEYLEYQAEAERTYGGGFRVKNMDAILKIPSNEQKELKIDGELISGKSVNFNVDTWYGYGGRNQKTCPDIIVFSDDLTYNQIWKEFYSNGNISSAFYSALSDSYFSESASSYLLVSENPSTRLQMATIYPYTGYFGARLNYDIQSEVDLIVNKYLAIDGWKDLMDDVNLFLDTKEGMDDITEKIKEFLILQIENGTLSVEATLNDIETLQRFDEPLGGVFNALENYLSKYNITVSKWYDDYMPGSPTKYVRALLMILPSLDNTEMKEKITQLNELKKASVNYGYCKTNFMGDEDKIKENCAASCINFMTQKCNTTRDPNGCINNASLTCSKADSNSIQSQMNEQIDDSIQDIDDILTVKLVELFENRGIEIGDDQNQLCNILLGKDNENGLYPYIRGVINITRIGGSVLVVVLTGFDVMKVISSFKDDENKKFWNHIKVRLVCLIILILVPTIINALVKSAISKCVADI